LRSALLLPAWAADDDPDFARRAGEKIRTQNLTFACWLILFFVTRKIARAVAWIARNLDTELVLEKLEGQRDWSAPRVMGDSTNYPFTFSSAQLVWRGEKNRGDRQAF